LRNKICKNSIGIINENSKDIKIKENEIMGNDIGVHNCKISKGEIKGNKICNNNKAGIENNGHIRIMTIRGNEIRRNNHGISCSNLPDNSMIIGNVVNENREAGILCYLSNPLILKNKVYKNHIGVQHCGSKDIKIIENEIIRNNKGMCNFKISKGEIKGNKICNNADAGIENHECVRLMEICSNEIKNNRYGVECWDKTEMELRSNSINGGESGIKLWEQSEGKIVKNKIYDIENIGIQCNDMSNVFVRDNEFKNMKIGIGIDGLSQASIISNNMTVKRLAIEFRDRSKGVIKSNYIQSLSKKEVTGIQVQGLTDTQIKGNDISKAAYGIRCSEESRVKLTRNKLNAVQCGIECFGNITGEIKSNEIEGAERKNAVGIYVNGLSEVLAGFNVIRNVREGVRCSDESHIELKNNKITSENGVLCEGKSIVKGIGDNLRKSTVDLRSLSGKKKIFGRDADSNIKKYYEVLY
jgi:parallel beta-helix repeat protein